MGKFYKILFALLIVSSFNNIIANNIPPEPEAQISSSFSSVCLNQVATITFSITNGSPQPNSPINYTYTLNGVQGNQFSPNNSDAVTINVNTSIPGTYTYTLINATDSSNPNSINIPISNTSNIVTITVLNNFTVNAGNDIVVCQGQTINFNATVSNYSNQVNYSWNGPSGFSSNIQNPTRSNATDAMAGTYTVTATYGSCQVTDQVNVRVLTLGIVNTETLSACVQGGETSSDVGFTLSLPSNINDIQTISVNWGDGSPIQIIPSSQWTQFILHNYSAGFYNVTVTLTSTNGCSLTKNYTSFIGTSPQAATLSLFANQATGCAPHTTQYTLSIPIANSNGTNYRICFGDNAPCIDYVGGDPIPNNWIIGTPANGFNVYTITHVFYTSSCGNQVNLNGTLYNNVFLPSVVTTNPCTAPQPQAGSLISVGIPPTASFTPNPIPNICTNTALTLTNNSDFGQTINPVNLSCTSTAPFYWTVTPNASGLWTATGLGSNNNSTNTNAWTVGSISPSITFIQPGTYTITLIVKNTCGISQDSRQVCVEPPLSPQFTLNTIEGCSPLAVTSTNTTNLTNICPGNPTYQWNVNYVAGYCGSGTPTWSFTNGTSATSANPSFNFVTPGTYNVSVTMTNSCGAITSSIQNIIVKQPPTVTINTIPDYCGPTTINPTANINSCSPSSSSLSYLWNFPGATTIPAGAINASNPSGIIYSLPGTYTISLTVTNECGSTTSSRTFTVKPLPTATISGDISVCQNATSPTITFTATSNSASAPNTTNPPYIFTYNINGGSNLTVTSSTATATVSVPTNTVGTFVYNLVSVQYGTSPSCSQSMTGSATVIINPSGQVNQPSNQIVCNNTSTSAVNFATTNTGGTTSYAWSFDTNIGLTPLTGTGNIPSFTAVNTGTTPLTATITVTPTLTNGAAICVGSPKTFTITINPSGQVNQSTNQVVCNNTATTAVNFSTTNTGGTTSYAWSFDTNIGLTPLTGTGNIPSFTAVNTSTTPIVATITVTPTFTNGATNCIGTPKTFTITVNPSGQVNQPTNQVVCNNTATNAVNFSTTNTNGTTSYAWSINTNIGLSPLTGTGDLPSFTAINTGTTPITATITVTPTYNGTSICNGTSKTFTITVNPSGQVNQPTNQVVCNNTATSTVNFSTTNTVGTTSYAWSFDTNIGLIPLTGSGNIPSFTAVNTGTTPIVATITVTPTFTNGATNCIGSSKTFTITVNPSAQVNPIPNQTLCSNNSTTAINFTTNNTGGITNYNWTNSNTTIGLPASGTGNINAFNVTNSTANPITATITVTPSFSNGTPSCSGPSQTFTITVNPSPAVNFSPTNQTICSGETSALVTLSSATPGATFSWTAVQPAGITGVITSGTNTIPAQNLVNSTNAPITIIYVAVAATTGGNTCAGSTYNYTITVNPKPSITENFAEAICSGGSFSITPSNSTLNSIPTGTTYSWSAPIVTGGITGGTSATNQTSISGTLVNPTNIVQTATYTVTPRANGCAGNTFTVVISVNPKPVIANVTHPAICSENAFTVTPANGSGNIVPTGTTYTWTISNNSNITGASASSTPGITTISQTLTNTTNTAQTIVYTVTPTSGDVGNCVGSTFTITVVVNPKPLVQATTQAICSANAFTVTPTNGSGNIVPNTTTYTWTTPVSTPAGAITGGSAQTTGVNTISQTLTNTTTEVATIEYTVTPMAGACAGIPFIITITVNPTPTTLSLTNQTYCNGVSTTEIAFTNAVAGTTYTWTNSNTSIGLAASGTGNIPVFTPTNGGTAPIIANISVIATANGCSRVAETFTITVNPSPVVTFSPTNQTICSGETSALVNLSSTTPGATFSWTATQPTGITGVATSGTNTIPAQTLVNTTNAPIDVNYTAVAATNDTSACAGSSFTYTITVNPKPSIENQSFIICSEEGFTVDPIDGIPNTNTIVPLGTTYNWVISNNPNISGASSGTGSQISQVLTNNSTLIQTIVYTVTPIAGICTGNPFTITIEVYPRPDVTFDIPIQTICNETNTSLVTLNSTLPGNITYEWNATIPSGITGALSSGTNTIPVQTLINTTNAPLTITYAATATFNNNGSSCEGNVYNYSITVNPTFTSSGVVSNYNGYNVSVFGGNDGAINLTTIGGSGTYTYNWTGPNGFTSTAEDISGLFAGTYTVTINDGYCAPIVLTFTLTQPPELLIQSDLSLTINLICFGDNNGAVGVLITQESVPPYDYELYDSNGNLVTSIIDSTNLNPQFTGLVAGVYSLTVIDANGGRKTVTGLTVSQPDDIIITATTTPITCYGANNASITLTVTGGTGPYQAQWDNLATGFYQNNLAAGDYTILVTDSNGCTKTIVVNIPEAPIFTINPVVVNISCYGANDGSINLNLVGGIQPISLTWSDGSTAGLVRNNLAPGTYTVTIVDSKPCTIVRTFIIVEPQPLVLSANVQNALDCNNANSGSINLLVSGGTPPFTYSWSNGATTEDLNTISSGNYAVLVTDSRGCTKSAQYIVNRPQPLTLNVETDTNVNCETRDIRQIFEAQVSGGLPPIQLSWSSGTVSGSNNEFMTTDQDGLVILTATDALGCTTTYSLNVDIPVLGNASFDQTSYGYTAYGIYSILDPIQFTNTATGDYVSILWNFGDGTFSNEENPIHTYVQEGDYVVTQTVTYPFGCVYVHTISLLVEKGYLLVVPTAFTPNNDSLNDTYRPVTKGLKDVRLDVFDTWGSLIYSETGDVLRGWDGTINGVKSENGNYNCKVTAETFYGKIITVEETFVLIK